MRVDLATESTPLEMRATVGKGDVRFGSTGTLAIQQTGDRPPQDHQPDQQRFTKQDFRYDADTDVYRCPAGEVATRRMSTDENGKTIHVYGSSACPTGPLRANCTTSRYRRLRRWEHEAVLDAMQTRLDEHPDAMRVRRQTIEHTFGTLKAWMGYTHFLTRTLPRVATEMSLQVLAYNMKRVMKILGVRPLMQAIMA